MDTDDSEYIISHMKSFTLQLTMTPAPPAGKLALVSAVLVLVPFLGRKEFCGFVWCYLAFGGDVLF